MTILESGTLWNKLVEQTQHALQCGALQSIPTDYEFVEDGEIRFLVRILTNLDRKAQAKKEQTEKSLREKKDFNPFLPYEEDLFVTHLSPTHLCLLNKYNVVDYHLLIVTREFEQQETWLNLQDFAALWTVMAEFEGLAFYNAGKVAGASQPHKHLQVVPLPLSPNEERIPIDRAIASAQFQSDIGTIPSFPFRHAIMPLESDRFESPSDAAQIIQQKYHRLIETVGVEDPGTYNLLVTREWMLFIARSQESFQSIAVNSLGFAGALLVRDREQMQLIKALGPLKILQGVGVSHRIDSLTNFMEN